MLPELKGCNILEFADDGYSGADFNRPNFVKMMDLVKGGKIQVIVTKDYSRLGRDYLEVGNYMECIFPVLQVRYISVNDNYDSANSFGSTGGMSVALKNLVNALHCMAGSYLVPPVTWFLECDANFRLEWQSLVLPLESYQYCLFNHSYVRLPCCSFSICCWLCSKSM